MDAEYIKSLIFLIAWAIGANIVAYKNGFYQMKPSLSAAKANISLQDVIGAFVLFLSVQLLLAPMAVLAYKEYSAGRGGLSADFDQGWVNAISIIATAAGLIFFCLVIKPKTAKLLEVGGFKKLKEDLSWGVGAWFISFPVVSIITMAFTALLGLFHLPDSVDQVAVKFLKEILANPPLFWISFWLIIFAVPFIEELLFRGFLQTWLRQRFKPASAIALTSAIFAGFHFSVSQGWHNVDLLAALFFLSCYLGLLYEKRGSIWASASLHMTFNAISEVVIVFQEGGFPG